MSTNVAIVIAARNEGDNIADVVKLAGQYGDVIVVDNASIDYTVCEAKVGGAKVIRHWVDTHIRQSYVDGFRYAILSYDYIIQMDAGMSHSPYDIPRLLDVLEGGTGMVIGSRYVPGGRVFNQTFRKKIISRGATALARLVTGMEINDVTSGFRGFRVEVLTNLYNRGLLDRLWAKAHGFQIELLWYVWMQGYSIVELPITYIATRSSADIRAVVEALCIVFLLLCRRMVTGENAR